MGLCVGVTVGVGWFCGGGTLGFGCIEAHVDFFVCWALAGFPLQRAARGRLCVMSFSDVPPPAYPVGNEVLSGTCLTTDEGNNGVYYVNARNSNARPVIMYLLARVSRAGQPDEVFWWPPFTVGANDVVEVHMEPDPAGGLCYGTSFTIWHSSFVSEADEPVTAAS